MLEPETSNKKSGRAASRGTSGSKNSITLTENSRCKRGSGSIKFEIE